MEIENKLGHEICDRLKSMKENSHRHSWEILVQECYDFIDPTDGNVISSRSPGSDLYNEIYDATAGLAFQRFIAGMYSHNTPADQKFLDISSEYDDLNDNEEVSLWFNDITRILLNEISKSNYPLEIQQTYAGLGIPGQSAIICLPGESNILKFKTFHYKNTFIDENDDGLVDTLYRVYEMTARNAYLTFGDRLSSQILDASKDPKKSMNKFSFIHAIFPRKDRDIRVKDAENMPWASVNVEHKTKRTLKVSGYEEQPFACPRFYKDIDDVNGRSPGMKALAMVRRIEAEALTILNRANYDADPAMISPDDEFYSKGVSPGSRLIYNPHETGAKPEFLTIPSKEGLAQWVNERTEQAIKAHFFEDFFALVKSLPSDIERTAFELAERRQESVELLSPSRGRLKKGLYDPLFTRAINIAMRAGVFPEMPDAVKERPQFKLEYRGRLAILARSLDLRSINELNEFTERLAQFNPDVLDNADYDEQYRLAVDLLGVPSKVVRQKDKVLELREARAKQQQAQQQAEMLGEASKAVPNLNQEVKENSPLAALVSS